MTHMEWTDEAVLAARGQPCSLCALRTDGATNPAVTLGVVVGFGSDGGGSAALQPVCAPCGRSSNVVPCQGLPAPDFSQWVQEQRAADLAAWQHIEELGARLIEYSGTGLHSETIKEMANELCDLEYEMTGDTQVSSKLCDELGIDTGEETDADG